MISLQHPLGWVEKKWQGANPQRSETLRRGSPQLLQAGAGGEPIYGHYGADSHNVTCHCRSIHPCEGQNLHPVERRDRHWDKVFSKLKKIGETFQGLTEKERRDVIEGLPASYSTIHVLCSISPAELVTGVKSKNITPATSIRAARDYTTQIRFPGKAATDGEKGRWGAKQEHLFSVFRPAELPLEGEALNTLEAALRRVCVEHGVVMRQATTASIKPSEEERERAGVLEGSDGKGTHQKWFSGQSDELKKQFIIRTIDELRDTPFVNSRDFSPRQTQGQRSSGKSTVRHTLPNSISL